MLNDTKIKQIGILAMLDVSAKIPETQAALDDILNIVNDLQKIDTTGVKPMAHPFEMVQRLRVDEVSEENQRENYQQNAPLTEQGHYLVPKVL